MCADIVDGEDVRMIERRGGTCFLLESFQPIRISRINLRKDLNRDFTIKPCVTSAVDFAHATSANLRGDDVVCERRVGGYSFAQGIVNSLGVLQCPGPPIITQLRSYEVNTTSR